MPSPSEIDNGELSNARPGDVLSGNSQSGTGSPWNRDIASFQMWNSQIKVNIPQIK